LAQFCYRLAPYSNIDPFKSEILSWKNSFDLIRLCEFSLKDKWTLLYSGSRDGFGAKDFHSKCDGHSDTLTILKAKKSGFIFGGFTKTAWSPPNGYKSDHSAFLFSLTNQENKPCKMQKDENQNHYAIYYGSEYGPTFSGGSGGGDIIIRNNANSTDGGCSNLSHAYKHPQYAYGSNEAKTFLAGSYHFQLDEIEVYQKE
jgi:BTB/POZ domain-containing protein KCTD9